MKYRRGRLLLAALVLAAPAGAVAPSVEIVSQAGPHGTAPQQWLQRLAEAGAGATRLVAAGSAEPRVESLGESATGGPVLKVHAVLGRDNLLLLPTAEGPQRFRLHEAERLAEYFKNLATEGEPATAEPRGKFGLTQGEFTTLFERLQKPMPALAEGATLADAVVAAGEAAGVALDIDAEVAQVLEAKLEDATNLAGLSIGAALAIALRQEALALTGEPSALAAGVNRPSRPPAAHADGSPALRVVAAGKAKDAWPVGYKPERSPSQTVPGFFEFLTVEVEGYTLAEALDALGPRVTWKGKPLPIVWDRFAMRRDGIDPTKTPVKFPRRKTFYKNLFDKLATQGRLRLDLRIDEAGTPFLWLTR